MKVMAIKLMIVIQMMVSFCDYIFTLKTLVTKKTKSIGVMPRDCRVSKRSGCDKFKSLLPKSKKCCL